MFLNFFIPRLNSAILEPYSLLYFEKLTERFGKCRTRPYFRYRYAILKHIPPRSEAEGCGICAQNCVTIADKIKKNSLERWTLFTAKSQKFPGRISAQREKYALQRCDPDQKIFDDWFFSDFENFVKLILRFCKWNNHNVHQSYLGLAQPVRVGNVKDTSFGISVNPAPTSSLKSHLTNHSLEVGPGWN